MNSTSYLQFPITESFQRRAASAPEGEDRYVSVGGFVSIEELARNQEAARHRKRRYHPNLFGSVSPRSNKSRHSPSVSESWNNGSQIWSSRPTTPQQSEGSSPPMTPQTPCHASRQPDLVFNNAPTLHEDLTVSPGQHPHRSIWELDVSPTTPSPHQDLRVQPVRSCAKPQLNQPIELEGSLLLPSQGFPQSNPPRVPSYKTQQGYCALTQTRESYRLPQITIDPSRSPALIQSNEIETPDPRSGSSPNDLKMSTSFHRRKGSKSASDVDKSEKPALPSRTSSLRREISVPRRQSPPIPLSQMTMEQLMDILPTLDAAIIAHDWVPCMQKRHQEVKSLLQKMQDSVVSSFSVAKMEDELRKVCDQSGDVAKTFQKLFECAQGLQDDLVRQKDIEMDVMQAELSEATIALARSVSKHKMVCQSYEREMHYAKDMTRQAMDMLGETLEQNPETSGENNSVRQAQEILKMLMVGHEERGNQQGHVSSVLYNETTEALRDAYQERRLFQEVCDEQRQTISNMSQDLDRYVDRITDGMTSMHNKDKIIQKLKVENEALFEELRARTKAPDANVETKVEEERSIQSSEELQELQRSTDEEVFKRDVEITNLRQKLEKSFVREKELQDQIRSVLQTSQNENSSSRPGMLKRLFAGGSRVSPTLSTSNSFTDLTQTAFESFEKSHNSPSSLAKSNKTSPTLATLCGPNAIGDLQLPPPRKGHSRAQSSVEFGPRLRSGLNRSQDSDISSAVSNRFYHMPTNVKSATSASRPRTPKSANSSPPMEASERSRSRLGSAPELSELSSEAATHSQVQNDRQPMVSHQRELSGITEVTEDSESVKRNSSSPDSADKKMYLDNIKALGRL